MEYILRILATGTNELGDTLTRLSEDFFHTLGYENCRLNIHKTGREIDLEGDHVFEPRRVVAECKAHQEPVGGADLNKFAGVLDMERRRDRDSTVHGYFVSLSGFRESAKEQERDAGGDRFQLVDGHDVVQRLIDSGVVSSPMEACAVAGQACRYVALSLDLDGPLQMLATSGGWVWAVPFASNGIRTHIAYVHADGKALQQPPLAEMPIDLRLILVAPPLMPTREEVRGAYLDYLVDECGRITLEGMPADQEVGARGFRLESLYVPLELEALERDETQEGIPVEDAEQSDVRHDSSTDVVKDDPADPDDEADLDLEPSEVPDDSDERLTLGAALMAHDKIAILGPPGAGKSTLMKRIALAYADPPRRSEVADELTGEDYFPVLIRCRHLADLATAPFSAIFGSLMTRAEKPHLMDDFVDILQKDLRDGKLLLLIDGLDEISKTSDRVAFLQQLRTLISRYPRTRLVVTSRETGFRDVAGPVRALAECFRVCELSNASVSALIRAWHVEVLGDTSDSRREASELSIAIVSSDRVRRLAINPLLLTTLLLVKRWVGQLPRRRSVLYQKAVEVLLMTWNVEGHEPIDQEEALPQLAFVAHAMMERGVSSVDSAELTELLDQARADMPEILGFAKDSVSQFVGRVEERSSLLTLSGHRLVAGQLYAVYEFKHLTFQEYLAASAIVNGWVPSSERSKSLIDLIAPVVGQPRWKEVISLAAVLAGRNGSSIVELLIERLIALRPVWETLSEDEVPIHEDLSMVDSLVQCLADEVQIAPTLAEIAIRTAIDASSYGGAGGLASSLRGGRYFSLLSTIAMAGLIEARSNASSYGSLVAAIAESDLRGRDALCLVAEMMDEPIDSPEQLKAAAILMHAAFSWASTTSISGVRVRGLSQVHQLKRLIERVAEEGFGDELPRSLRFMRSWVLAWGGHVLRDEALINQLQIQLIRMWSDDESRDVRAFAAWALASLPLIGTWEGVDREALIAFAEESWGQNYRRQDHQAAALVVSVYVGGPWDATEIIRRLRDRPRVYRSDFLEKRVRRRLGLGVAAASSREESADASQI